MSGLADKNTKLAMVAGIYFSVAMIVGIGFTIRGAEVQARNQDATMSTQRTAPVANAPEKAGADAGKAADEDNGDAIGMTFDAGDLVDPALDILTKHAVRVVL